MTEICIRLLIVKQLNTRLNGIDYEFIMYMEKRERNQGIRKLGKWGARLFSESLIDYVSFEE